MCKNQVLEHTDNRFKVWQPYSKMAVCLYVTSLTGNVRGNLGTRQYDCATNAYCSLRNGANASHWISSVCGLLVSGCHRQDLEQLYGKIPL